MNVHTLKGRNRYCGPAVIALLTGMTTDDASRLIRTISRKPMVTGTSTKEMLVALDYSDVLHKQVLGHIPRDMKSRPTIAAWLETIQPEKLYLVEAGNHWQLIGSGHFVDGIVKKPVPVTDKRARRRSKIKNAWLVNNSQAVIPRERIDSLPKKNMDHIHVRRKIVELIKGTEIEFHDPDYQGGTIYVYPPEEFSHGIRDEYGEEHFCDSWQEALERAEVYLKEFYPEGELVK